MTTAPATGVFPDPAARERSSPAPSGDGRDIEFLNAVRIGVDVADHRAEFLYWGYYEPRPWRNYLHTHSFFEICYAYAGHGVFRTGEQDYAVDKGALFVARPGDVHEIVSSTADPLCVHFWSYTLVPSRVGRRTTGGAGGAAGPAGGVGPGRALLEAFSVPAGRVLSKSAGRIPGVLELLTHEAGAPGPAFREVVSSLAAILVVDAARAVVDDPVPVRSPYARRTSTTREEQVARTMVRYLQDNYDRPVAVRDVAAQVHLSDRHAGRLFRTYAGTTIHGFLVRHRLEIAAQRLLARERPQGRTSIAEIARSCGYPDVRHFTTAFRRHWGITPGVFRSGNGTAHLV